MEWWPLEVARAAVSNIKLQKKKKKRLLVTVLKKLPLVSFLFSFWLLLLRKISEDHQGRKEQEKDISIMNAKI